jgi:hypothetical protein
MNNRKVILCVKGGLGNQIFQLIAALNFCKKKSIPILYIYTPNLSSYDSVRTFDLDLRDFNLGITTRVIRKRNLFLNKIVLLFIKKIPNLFFKIINEQNYFNSNLSQLMIFDDYFQSIMFLKYDDCLETFKAEFNKVYALQSNCEHIFKSINFNNDFALHIRGTDFLNHPELINNNPSLILNKYIIKKIYVFTDDIAYANTILNQFNFEIIFVANYHLTILQEFYLLSNFKNLIITNSTFSLTASLLNTHIDARIFSPQKWYNSIDKNVKIVEMIDYFKFNLY